MNASEAMAMLEGFKWVAKSCVTCSGDNSECVIFLNCQDEGGMCPVSGLLNLEREDLEE